ncbi:leucyl/phenylalanyl-tRNA--protein transferase [Lichenihabitans sp. Uapishka_5]|uniref:leucyl/phenylalanyl-tRNA--protein transferase n=1 Tax=Lichenihabitans sp. Uapishka_5 TaxID=3037302 RepID=UPI0029E81D84|nr:leucyl/phenylalanyl-tRNA--protein transferase [Lichenihabitans sp. Uapishka_5]MDX7951162.1 leucyl/phenylalanyl-tRNA--protein transferase [Lichenihabitans sp. Uapishka_5]
MAPPHPPVELHPDLLLRAYAAGIFPMSEGADDPELFWVDPERRGVFPLDGLRIARSLAKVLRSDRFTVAVDRDFDAVIAGCAEAKADRPSTWINAPIRQSYGELFTRGFVHTVEVRQAGALVGGLYGVSLGGAFFGESMFHREPDASKVALAHLAARLVRGGFRLLDTQFVTPHLASLGAVEISRRRYRRLLAEALRLPATFPTDAALSGLQVLATLDRSAAEVTQPADHLPAGSLPPKSLE